MKRIDRFAARIATLTVKQDAEQNCPRFILHLSDGSTAELVAQLPKALMQLADLHIMPEREVLSIDKPEQLDSRTEQLYELFEYIVMGGVSVSDARTALLYADDSYLLPPERPAEPAQWPERNHNLI